jgi:hypothetical protein
MSDGTFYGYILLLVVSGITLAALAARGFGQSTGLRVIDGLFAAGFLGYAFYLLFVFDGGQVRILFYAFIVPIVAVSKAVRERWAVRQARALPSSGPIGSGAVPYAPAQPLQVPPPNSAVPPAPVAAYAAPVLTGRTGAPVSPSPYGRHTPGQPIGSVPVPDAPDSSDLR